MIPSTLPGDIYSFAIQALKLISKITTQKDHSAEELNEGSKVIDLTNPAYHYVLIFVEAGEQTLGLRALPIAPPQVIALGVGSAVIVGM